MSADPWGIDDSYQDAMGAWHHPPVETRDAIRRTMGGPPPEHESAVRVVVAGESFEVPRRSELLLEDGRQSIVEGTVSGDLPWGYHWLRDAENGRATRLIISPGRCHLPDHLQLWGWAAQLYSVRSQQSWGIGDFGDLRQLAGWSASQGAGMIVVNPLAAGSPTLPQEPSPYYASSRRFRNPLYLRIEDIPGASALGDQLAEVIQAGRALNAQRHIDRDTVYAYKRAALDKIWANFGGDRRFDEFLAEQGDSLRQFAAYCVLAEEHGADWRRWPEGIRHPQSTATLRLSETHADRLRFHAWLQWLLDEQLAAAARVAPIMQDLPIGFDPSGADAWAWQDLLALDMYVGAPPYMYNTQGQNWGLPAFIPWKLKAAGYQPFIDTIRACLRHAGGLRIDHVIGLFRLFWIPAGRHASEGAYIRYPAEDLLNILALESVRAGAIIVGEDLGTVEAHVRQQLAEHRLLSYRVLYFEPQPPENYPYLSLATVTTHDLPTIAGLWTGSDLQDQRNLDLNPNEEGTYAIRNRVRELGELDDSSTVDETIVAAHRALAAAQSAIVVGTLEDAAAMPQRPNMPGTTNEKWPNWCQALPETLEELESSPRAHAVAEALRSRMNHHQPV